MFNLWSHEPLLIIVISFVYHAQVILQGTLLIRVNKTALDDTKQNKMCIMLWSRSRFSNSHFCMFCSTVKKHNSFTYHDSAVIVSWSVCLWVFRLLSIKSPGKYCTCHVLGPVLGLESQVLGPGLGFEPSVLVNITGKNYQNIENFVQFTSWFWPVCFSLGAGG